MLKHDLVKLLSGPDRVSVNGRRQVSQKRKGWFYKNLSHPPDDKINIWGYFFPGFQKKGKKFIVTFLKNKIGITLFGNYTACV